MITEQELERIRENVRICNRFIDENDANTPPELLFVLGVVEELAEKLGVVFPISAGDLVGVSIVWDNDPEKLVWHEVIGVGFYDEFSDEHDEDIFYYIENMGDLESLRVPENGSGWYIVGVDE
jgi:hypothetical protein